jgi:glycosyltransferase involved in cell wall biosynthesis
MGQLPPTVVTIHDLVYRFAGSTMGPGARWTKRVFQGWSVKRASKVVAVSKATADDVETVYGRRADAVIQPTADRVFRRLGADALETVRLKFDLPPRYWLCAGTLEPRKNLVQLLEAYLATLKEGADLPMLVLAGSGGWGDDRLNELIAAGVAANKIRKLGYVAIDDLAGLYGACELLWMPSIYEGFGMPLLEAQRCGAPVVHGTHASMVEASAGIGLATGTGAAAMMEAMRSLARGEAPLACRLFGSGDADSANEASRRMWECICMAGRESREKKSDSALV